MSDINRYFHLIEHNVKLLDLLTGYRPKHLEKEDFSGWEVTVIFYISKFYRNIEEASKDARYEGKKFSKIFMINTILPKFNIIRDCIINIIKRKGVNTVVSVDIEPFLARLA